MKLLAVLVCSAVLAVATASLAAHQETFKGQVLSVERTSVRVNVLDPATKAEAPRAFTLNAETKVLRGDAVVTLASAKIVTGENIAVTVDHDVDVNLALVIRLDAAK
jgi:hypothetical protein